MKTLLETRLTLDVSLLARPTVMPPAGAGIPKVTWNGACWPGGTVTLEGRVIAPCTVTFDVASGMLGRPLAWITAEPGPTAVTGTDTVLVPAANVTEEGTVATFTFVELRLMVIPGGAAAER